MANLTYFKKFDTKSDYDAYIDGTPVLPNVSIVANEDVYFTDERPEPPHDYTKDYLTFEILSNNGVIKWKASNESVAKTIEYSKDNGLTWNEITSTTAGASINVSSGDTIMFRGNNDSYSSGHSVYNSFVGSTASFNVFGNVMSLINSTGFTTAKTITEKYALGNLFNSVNLLKSAENMVLPATSLNAGCYYRMFYGCEYMIAPPSIFPAMELTTNCYYQMFLNCKKIITATKLPATTLAAQCYYQMFQGCQALTTAPELPATTLVNNCYERMFTDCKHLNSIKCLATDISATNCTNYWLYGVASNGTFVTPSSTNWATESTSGIPAGWTRTDA